MAWHRSQLRRDAAGILACPDDQSGLDSLTLSEGNAAAATHRQMGLRTEPLEGTVDSKNTVPDPGFVDPNGIPLNPVNQGPTGPLSVIVDLWLRADSVETAGGVVTRWTDQSNRSNHGFPNGLGSAPTLAIDTDGLPMVVFSGTQWLNSTNPMSSRPQWLWMVFSVQASAGGEYPVRANPGIRVTATTMRAAGTFPAASTVPYALGDWGRATLRSDVNDTSNVLTWKSVSSPLDAGLGVMKGVPVTIGAGNSLGGNAVAMRVKELLIAEGPPTAAEINAIEAYGVARYGASYFA